MNRSAFKDLFLIATLIFLVNVVLMLFGSLYISKSISNPIYALIGMMNTVKDRNFRKIPVKYPKSEIGILQTNYNNMVDEISSCCPGWWRSRKSRKRRSCTRCLSR